MRWVCCIDIECWLIVWNLCTSETCKILLNKKINLNTWFRFILVPKVGFVNMSEANICRSGNVLHFKKRRLPGSNNNDSYLVHLHQSLWGNKKASEMLAIWWCRRWDLNPHGFPHDFESCASAVPPLRHNNVNFVSDNR